MKNMKKVISCLMAIALVLTVIPMGMISTEAAGPNINADASLVLNRPQASVIVTEVTRVAYQTNSMKAPSGNNSVIVQSTPSGIPYLSSTRRTIGYAGETPVATTVVFTPGAILDETPVLACGNSTVKWTGPVYSNGTYTWTVTGGTAMPGSTLVFTVSYVYSETNPVSGKTYTHTYSTSGTSYVEPIATPAGLYSVKRTYSNWGLGTTTKNRSYLSSFILGKNTYGSIYDNGSPDGSVDFAASSWTGGASWTDEYGMMQYMSDSDASRGYNVGFKVDSNRPMSTVYFDTSIYSTLSDLNLRAVSTVMNQSDESDEIVTVKMNDTYVFDGYVETAADSNDELSLTSDTTQLSQLNITKPSTNLYAIGSNFIQYFTGVGPGISTGETKYTVCFEYKTEAGWNDVFVSHSYNVNVVSYDKGALRTLVENVQSTDPSVKITSVPSGDYKGYNPQAWYYASGFETFSSALNSARACLDKPNVTQAEIDASYNSLSAAYDALEMKTADYSLANLYYTQAMNKNPNNYTLASWAKLQTLLDNYRSDYSVLYQPAVDKLAVDIKAAIDALEERYADYSVLLNNLTTVNTLMKRAETVYGKPAEKVYSGWSNLVSVLSKSGCVYNELDGYTIEDYLLISDQPKVDGYVILIERALNGIGLSTADYSNASKAESAYKVININYVVSDIASSLTSAYNALVALHNLDITHQAEIDNATATLNYWLDMVEYKPADTSAAEAKIAYANSIDRSLYNDFSGVDSAIQNLRSKLNLDIRYQDEINRAVSALQSAIDRLTANSADYTAVDNAIEAVAERERLIIEAYEDTYGFTASTFYSNWNAVVSAINSVVRGLDINAQSQVDGYASAINNALASLTEKPADYTQVNTLRNQAYNICTTGGSLYTEESLDNLLAIYMSVDNSLTLSRQADVDAYAQTIQDAMDNLVYLPADYSSVNTQISNANTKIAADRTYSDAHPGYTLYTIESMADVEVALAAVVDGLDIRYQSTVNGYATDISNAISGLKYAPADYSLVNAALANVPADTSIYTTVSLSTLNTYINSINYTYTADKQATVDKYATNINNAISKLKLKSASYTEVNKALAKVPADSSVYTEDSWQALQDQINAVVTGYDITRQSEVDTMAANINNAINLLAYKGADYSKVDEAKSKIPSDLSIYTDESVAELNAVLDSIDYYCNITQQSTVDGYAASINAAVEGLTESGADYSAVTEAINSANGKINSGLYNDESVAAVQEAINAVEYGLGTTHQAEVIAMAEAINNAADAMVYKNADYSTVETAIANANEKLDSGLYTDETAAAVQNAIDAVVNGLDITHQAQVNAMAEAINNATDAMEYKPADYSMVEAAIVEANSINTDFYTDESVRAVLDAVDAVVENLNITHQSEVNDMADAIFNAIRALDYKTADYSEVEKAITVANSKINTGLYTDESVARVHTAINAVIFNLDITHRTEIDAMAEAINNAADAMVYKNADYSTVETAIANANEKLDSGLYTDESVAAVRNAIEAVVNGLDITHQTEVNAMADTINSAVDELVYKPADYSGVEAAKATIPSDLSIYTDESVSALNDVLDSIDYNLNITQQGTVDAYASSINAAVEGLSESGADYTAVTEAITSANEKIASGLYTDESVSAVQTQINAVEYGLGTTHQGEVDAMATAINDAADAMEYKPADYSLVEVAIAEAISKINTGFYTDETVVAVQNAIGAVVENLDITHQSEVDDMANAIFDAVRALDYKLADYSEVEKAITDANAKINTGLYTDETVARVRTAIDAVIYNLDVTHRTEVDAMASAINNASDMLEYKSADYTELNTAVKDAEEKIATGYYTEDSVSALDAKINAIISNLDITHQDEIDNWKDDIVKATKELELKLADYTELQKILNLLDNSASEIYTISYTNFNEVMSLISDYRSSNVRMDVTADRQPEVDEMVSTLQGYIDSLIPYVAPTERFEFVDTADYTEVDGINYAFGFKTLMTKSQLAGFIDSEGVYYDVESSNSRYIGTGSVIRVYSEETDDLLYEFVVVIYGDVDGNARVDFDDASAINLALSGESDALSGASKLAANVYGSRATINAQDADAILDAATGYTVISQVTGKVVD